MEHTKTNHTELMNKVQGAKIYKKSCQKLPILEEEKTRDFGTFFPSLYFDVFRTVIFNKINIQEGSSPVCEAARFG